MMVGLGATQHIRVIVGKIRKSIDELIGTLMEYLLSWSVGTLREFWSKFTVHELLIGVRLIMQSVMELPDLLIHYLAGEILTGTTKNRTTRAVD